jgi:hypothetical protein
MVVLHKWWRLVVPDWFVNVPTMIQKDRPAFGGEAVLSVHINQARL